MDATTTNTTRRAILGGAAIAAAVPNLALAADNSRDGVSLDFKRRVSAYRSAKRVADRFEDEVYNPVRDAFHAAVAELPHSSFQFGERTITTDSGAHVAVAKGMQNVPRIHLKEDARQAHRQLLAAHEAREAKKWELRETTGLNAADAQSQALAEAMWNALAAVESYTPKSLAELHAKLAFLIETGAADADETLPRTLEEIVRLLAQA